MLDAEERWLSIGYRYRLSNGVQFEIVDHGDPAECEQPRASAGRHYIVRNESRDLLRAAQWFIEEQGVPLP
jgi:hypothetical protein